MDDKNITRFVACDYDCKWWVGCVLCTQEETNTVKTVFSSSQCTDHSTSKFTMYVKQVLTYDRNFLTSLRLKFLKNSRSKSIFNDLEIFFWTNAVMRQIILKLISWALKLAHVQLCMLGRKKLWQDLWSFRSQILQLFHTMTYCRKCEIYLK
jgi:hypothetical protein